MKVLSLLPSATEIVYALGGQENLVGVSCDCDYPEDVSTKPVVSAKVLPISSITSPAEIDRVVRDQLQVSDSIYSLDRALIQQLRPDVILAQDLCRVCAVPSGHVEEALDVIGCTADVLSLDPHSLEEVLGSISTVGIALGVAERAEAFVTDLRGRLSRVHTLLTGVARKRVVALEWQDPPFSGGHWVPEMIEAAGGFDPLGTPGGRSRTLTWAEITAASPDVLVYMPCGYDLVDAVGQLPLLFSIPEFRNLPAVLAGELFVTDSSAYFSRSGPRLIDGVEILAGFLHPSHIPPPPPERALRVGLSGGQIETYAP
jgi:iron complex transport system substrate-binding protein